MQARLGRGCAGRRIRESAEPLLWLQVANRTEGTIAYDKPVYRQALDLLEQFGNNPVPVRSSSILG